VLRRAGETAGKLLVLRHFLHTKLCTLAPAHFRIESIEHSMSDTPVAGAKPSNNFLRQIIEDDLANNRNGGKVATRFPPEPNGYLHIGHAKSICLNFGLAEQFGGTCNLRFDDTNPEKENQEFIDSIQADVRWLGFNWSGEVRYASNYFDQLYQWALQLIRDGKAYVCHLSPDEAREYRGTLTEPGRNSPYRERSVGENLALIEQMRSGVVDEGACVLRAKIDMAAPNINLRDPILYRVRKASHHQTGNTWCIYPTYDYAHGQSDAIEGITHSICTLEFEDHRPLYEWLIANLPVPAQPKQYEFSRLNLNYTVTSKRKLKQLVDEKTVNGWDDPRMPTIAGMRRRGYTAQALRNFCDMIGVTRSEGIVDVAMLEFAVRDDLDKNAPRAMCVLDPLKVVITNFDEGKVEWLSAPNHPSRDDLGSRQLPFTRELVIDRADFREEANKKYKRLVLGKKVRLRNAYVITADEVIRDAAGNIVELRCSYDAATHGADPADGVKPKGVIHWVSATEGKKAEVRVYDRLFVNEAPDDLTRDVNPNALTVLAECYIEPSLAAAAPETGFQFEREGYFVADRYDHTTDKPVFNKTIGLRDTFNDAQAAGE
jgi:glutaminyl-tRNA synthetase